MTEKARKWWEKSVAYQIYPISFQDSNGDGFGDLQGIIQHLPYLQNLGVDLIWISPIYDSPKDDNGYDISDYQKIDPQYGTMADFDELLQKAHALGMKVIMDLVINHTSDRHQWFIESRSSKNNPKRDWYIWRDSKDGKEPNNWESIFGGSAWQYDEKTNQYFLHVFGKTMPDINWENSEVKHELFQMIQWWLDKGIDGFRVDAITHIHKPDLTDMPKIEGQKYVSSFDKHMNQPGIHKLLEELRDKAFAPYDIFTVAEANGVKTSDVLAWIGSKEGKFQSLFQFEHHSLWDTKGNDSFSLSKLKQIFSKWQAITQDDGYVALMLENHDLPRSLNRFGTVDETYREDCAKCLAMMYMLQKGVPFIYQGEELGMTNVDYTSPNQFRDPPGLFRYQERINAGMSEEDSFQMMKETERDNARTPMQWDTAQNAGFTTGKPWIDVNQNYHYINAKQQKDDDTSVLNFYRKLIALRKSIDTLMFGKYELLLPQHEQIYAYIREDKKNSYLVICNLSNRQAVAGFPYRLKRQKLLLTNKKERIGETIFLPYECRLYEIVK